MKLKLPKIHLPFTALIGSTLPLLPLYLGAATTFVPGPTPQIPQDGAAPGAFPNYSVTAVNVIAHGSTTFTSDVDVLGLDGQGPIPWSISRYNRGDIALRLAPGNPSQSLTNLGQGFSQYSLANADLPPLQAWRPHPELGVIIPTARQNGPVDWNDGEPAFYPTIAVSEESSGPGYGMVTGAFGGGELDINTGRAGTHASSPEANFEFSATWFPYDQGWIAGEPNGPDSAGTPSWKRPGAHSGGITTNIIQWLEFPPGSGTYGGLAQLRLPGIQSQTDGMLFATSSDGASALNIVGVTPMEDSTGWTVTIREDSATNPEELAVAAESEFQFVYIPYSSPRLIGGHIQANGDVIDQRGDFSLTRTGIGRYELSIPDKKGNQGTLLLQNAHAATGTSVAMASPHFFTYQYNDGRQVFQIESRITSTDTEAIVDDASFYFAWVDFAEPLAPPTGPGTLTTPVLDVTDATIKASEACVAINTDASEILLTTIDTTNAGAYLDPITGESAKSALIGYFYNPVTLEKLFGPFVILANPDGEISRHDVKYNPVSKQYVVVADARSYRGSGKGLVLVALVKNYTDAGDIDPVAKAFVHDDPATTLGYDDVAVAVSSKNGNFLIAAEYKFTDGGEGCVGMLYDKEGKLLTPALNRLDVLQPSGDEDDPDVIYLPGKDAFLFITNTDKTGELSNRVTGTVIQTTPDNQGNLVQGEQQLISSARLGTAEGHPASIENPFSGELITAFDVGGNNVSNGDLSYYSIGAGPAFPLTESSPQSPYLESGTPGIPFRHNHPQLDVDPAKGIFVLAYGYSGSTLGYAPGIAFSLLGRDGQLLPSQMSTPYLWGHSAGVPSTSANFFNVKYEATSDAFITVFADNLGGLRLSKLQVRGSLLGDISSAPVIRIGASGANLTLSWPGSATDAGYTLKSSPTLSPATWTTVAGNPVTQNGTTSVTVPKNQSPTFFRLEK